MNREIHPDFQHYLKLKNQELIDLYCNLRDIIIEIQPDCNELLYSTHALTSVYSISGKLADGFCHIPIYTNHLNLGFNKGTLLKDKDNLLQGTGKLIRHIPITTKSDFDNKKARALIEEAINFAIGDMDKPAKVTGTVISKIKIN